MVTILDFPMGIAGPTPALNEQIPNLSFYDGRNDRSNESSPQGFVQLGKLDPSKYHSSSKINERILEGKTQRFSNWCVFKLAYKSD